MLGTVNSIPDRTIGVDVGDRWCSTCTISRAGEVLASSRIWTVQNELQAVNLDGLAIKPVIG